MSDKNVNNNKPNTDMLEPERKDIKKLKTQHTLKNGRIILRILKT